MRTPIYVLIAALLVGGCTHYHVTPAGTPAQPDRVVVPPREPLELEIGRPSGGQLLLQTSRPAYVAIFEIIPNRSVTLIYPASAAQQNMMVSGLTWVPLWWAPKRVTFNSDRYIYAVASEEPLQLSGETFVTGYFHRVLGPGIYRAERPYATMRAISHAVVPNVADDEWAEDVHVITPTYLTEVYRTARIYCPGGRVFDVPEDMAARVWCPTRTRVVIIDASRPRARGDYPVGRPARPDSVFGQGGVRVKLEPRRRGRGPIYRVVDPAGRDRDDRDDRGRARDVRRDEKDSDSEKPKRGRIADLIREREEAERAKQQEKQERENRRREAEEARRQEAEEREAARRREAEEREEARRREAEERRTEREARKNERDERNEERRDEREARKDDREDRKADRKDEPKQQGQPREEKQDKQNKRDEKREEKQEKREESRDDNKGRRSAKDLIKEKEKEKEKEKKDKP